MNNPIVIAVDGLVYFQSNHLVLCQIIPFMLKTPDWVVKERQAKRGVFLGHNVNILY